MRSISCGPIPFFDGIESFLLLTGIGYPGKIDRGGQERTVRYDS
jgi:hypothetical protein